MTVTVPVPLEDLLGNGLFATLPKRSSTRRYEYQLCTVYGKALVSLFSDIKPMVGCYRTASWFFGHLGGHVGEDYSVALEAPLSGSHLDICLPHLSNQRAPLTGEL